MDYDNFGTVMNAKRAPTFIPNRVNALSGKQLMEGTSLSSDLGLEGNGIFAFRDTFSEVETTEGLRLGIDKFDNKAKLFIGDSTHFMKWDGVNATINGILYSTEGNIAGWIINTDSLTGTNVKLKSTGEIISGDFSGNRVEVDGIAEEIRFYDENNEKSATIKTSGTAGNTNFLIDVTPLTAGASMDIMMGGDTVLSASQALASGKTFVTLGGSGGIFRIDLNAGGVGGGVFINGTQY